MEDAKMNLLWSLTLGTTETQEQYGQLHNKF